MPKFVEKEIDKKKSIGEVAKELGIEAHVIRFWETKFSQIKPVIGRGQRRYYLAKDVEMLKKIKSYLYDKGYKIEGLQKLLSDKENLASKKDLANMNHKESLNNSDNLAKEEAEKLIHNIELKLQKLHNFLNNQTSN